MMLPLHEIDLLGVFVAPFALCAMVAVTLTYIVQLALRRIAPGARWTRSPMVELALLVGSISGFVLLLGRI